MAFIAGATNAGGFLAVQQYTSHMTGMVSSMADHLVLGDYTLVIAAGAAILCFLMGAACTAVMVNFARRRRMASQFALPLMLEAILLVCFGVLGARLAAVQGMFIPLTVMLLCFLMGLQNAVITKISNAEIRTTHLTGHVTDIGIELGKLFYWNMDKSDPAAKVMANRPRLRMLSLLVSFFFLGGVVGAVGFKHFGFLSTVPLALVLIALAFVPTMDDLLRLRRRLLRQRADLPGLAQPERIGNDRD